MVEIRIMSVADPYAEPTLALLGVQLLSRGQVMGFLPDGIGGELTLDAPLVGRIAGRLAAEGIARAPALELTRPRHDAAGLEEALRETIAAVDESPHPDGEWEPARVLLGDDLLARLVRISPASLRRYASGLRRTPDDVAWRLHAVARILASLLGSYNEYGIRRWFDRPRTALGGHAPAEVFARAESEDDEGLLTVLRLADALVGGAGAT